MIALVCWFSRLFFIFCLLLILSGCANPIGDMTSFYNEKRFIEAGRMAVALYPSPDQRPQVVAFIQKNGPALLDKAYQEGLNLMNQDKSDAPILYWKTLDKLISDMMFYDFPITDLEQRKAAIAQKEEETLSQFLKAQSFLAQEAYTQKKYRKALQHLYWIRQYGPETQPKLDTWIKGCRKKASRSVVVAEFYKPTDGFAQFVSDTLSKWLTGKVNPELHKSVLSLNGIDVPAVFTRRLLATLSEKSSSFMTYRLGTSGDEGSYYLEGVIDITETSGVSDDVAGAEHRRDTLQYTYYSDGISKTAFAPFDYFVYKTYYKVSVSIAASLYLSKTKEKIASFGFEEPYLVKTEYRSDPIGVPQGILSVQYPQSFLSFSPNGVIDKSSITSKAIQQATQTLSTKVLALIDKDLDPYLQK